MSKQKAKGTHFETNILMYIKGRLALAGRGQDMMHREVLHGSADRGDISGLKIGPYPVVIECKNYSGTSRMPEWLRELRAEMENAHTILGAVVSKRKGVGDARTGEQLVSMTLDDFMCLYLEATREKR